MEKITLVGVLSAAEGCAVVAHKNICELGQLSVNFHAPSGPARAHCCLTDEQLQDAPGPT
jgi:hypothetical protein